VSGQDARSAATSDREKALEAALIRVLEWPLLYGTVEEWALPSWLASRARMALEIGVWDEA
jgi:hypothetical protein